jgi:hypothetical protein
VANPTLPQEPIDYWAALVFLLSVQAQLRTELLTAECQYLLHGSLGVNSRDEAARALMRLRKPLSCTATIVDKTISLHCAPLVQAKAISLHHWLSRGLDGAGGMFWFLRETHPDGLGKLPILCVAGQETLLVTVDAVERYCNQYDRMQSALHGAAPIDSAFARERGVVDGSSGAVAVVAFQRARWRSRIHSPPAWWRRVGEWIGRIRA